MRYIFSLLMLLVFGCSSNDSNSGDYIDISYLYNHFSTFEANAPYSVFSEAFCFEPRESGEFYILDQDGGIWNYTWEEDDEVNHYLVKEDEDIFFKIEILELNSDKSYTAKLKQGILTTTVLIHEDCPFE